MGVPRVGTLPGALEGGRLCCSPSIISGRTALCTCLSVTQIIGFGSALLEDVDPNPANFVGAGIIHTKTTQIGCLLRLEPNLQAQVRLLEEIAVCARAVSRLWCDVGPKWSRLRSSDVSPCVTSTILLIRRTFLSLQKVPWGPLSLHLS